MHATRNTDLNRLGQVVNAFMEEHGVPGVAVGILHEGEIAAAGFGVTNVDHPLPVTDETLFQIGSITKTFTGTAIMRLVERGKVDLDAPARTFLPDFKVADKAASSQATVRHLLTHMGGWIGDFFHDTGGGDDALPRYVAEMVDLEQLAPLGTVWSYNNAGFYVAGYIIETVTGKSYQAALSELVLEPLGLENVYLDPGDVMTHRFAVGHNVEKEGAQVARPWPLPRAAYPAGGIACRVKDLLRYARFHLGDGTAKDGTRLLEATSMALMHSPQVSIWGADESMGLTWFVTDVDGTRQLSHGGGTVGQISLLTLVPEHNFAVAVFTNANRGGFVTHDVTRWALKHYLGLESPEPTPLESSEGELKPYVGHYSRPYSDADLYMQDGQLLIQMTPKGGFPAKDSPPSPAPPPMVCALCEKDRLLVLDGPFKDSKAEIVRRPDGSIGWLRMSRRIHRRENK